MDLSVRLQELFLIMGKISGKKDIRFETFAVKSDWSFISCLKQMCLLMSALVQKILEQVRKKQKKGQEWHLRMLDFQRNLIKVRHLNFPEDKKEEWQLPEF